MGRGGPNLASELRTSPSLPGEQPEPRSPVVHRRPPASRGNPHEGCEVTRPRIGDRGYATSGVRSHHRSAGHPIQPVASAEGGSVAADRYPWNTHTTPVPTGAGGVVCERAGVHTALVGHGFDLDAFTRAAEARDPEQWLDFYAPDAQWWEYRHADPPRSPHVMRGRAEIGQHLRGVCAAPLTIEIGSPVPGPQRSAFMLIVTLAAVVASSRTSLSSIPRGGSPSRPMSRPGTDEARAGRGRCGRRVCECG